MAKTTTPAPEKKQLSLEWQPFDMVNSANTFFTISAVFILIGMLYLGLNIGKYGTPLRLGIDFTGGTLISISYDANRSANLNAGEIEAIVKTIDNQAPTVQVSEPNAAGERSVLIRASTALAGEEGRTNLAQLFDELEQEFGAYLTDSENISEVSPTISGELVNKAILGLFWGNLLVFLYVTLRMRIDFAAFGIVALLHDMLMTLGFMAVMSFHFGWEVNSWFVAVILTILGYSINDTIIIYDRIRENLHLFPGAHFPTLVNLSLIQTLTRSIYTSLTVWFVLAAMLVGQMLEGGAGGLKEFNAVMLAGMVFGAYSSIFIAAQALVAYYRKNETSGKRGFIANPAEERKHDKVSSPVIANVRKVERAADEDESEGTSARPPAIAAKVEKKTISGADIMKPSGTAGSGGMKLDRKTPGSTKAGSRPKKKRW